MAFWNKGKVKDLFDPVTDNTSAPFAEQEFSSEEKHSLPDFPPVESGSKENTVSASPIDQPEKNMGESTDLAKEIAAAKLRMRTGVSNYESDGYISSAEQFFNVSEADPALKKRSVQRKRDQEIHLRVTASERTHFLDKVSESGLSQVDFFVQLVENGYVLIDSERNEAILELCNELKSAMAEFGRQGGMLKKIMGHCVEHNCLSPEERDIMNHLYHETQLNKSLARKALENIVNVNSKA